MPEVPSHPAPGRWLRKLAKDDVLCTARLHQVTGNESPAAMGEVRGPDGGHTNAQEGAWGDL